MVNEPRRYDASRSKRTYLTKKWTSSTTSISASIPSRTYTRKQILTIVCRDYLITKPSSRRIIRFQKVQSGSRIGGVCYHHSSNWEGWYLIRTKEAWVSTRKCVSAFMKSFRSLKERLESCSELNEGEPITCKGGDIAAFNGFAPHRSDSKQCCLRK